jgi:uncharacterized protein YciI
MRIALTALLVLSIISAGAQDRGYSIVFLNKKDNADQLEKNKLDSLMKGHMANMARLSKEGKLLAAGPFHGGGGLFIMNSIEKATIEEWISTDPGIIAKRWNIEILPYEPVSGGVCPVKEPYEMTNYSFVRYDVIVSKFNASTYPQILQRHDEYVKQLMATGNVVTRALFGKENGGILIMKGELDPRAIEADPGIMEGLIEVQLKKLYIARGSFCEQ